MAGTSGSLKERMVGAAMLSVDTYEEVEADQTALGQAAVVVAIVAACRAIASWQGGLFYAVYAAAASLVAWVVWAGVTYLIGDKVFGAKATWGEVMRTVGFAQAPGVLFLLGILPLLGGVVTGVVSIWILVAGFIGLRQALDLGNGKTFLTLILGGLCYALLQNLSPL